MIIQMSYHRQQPELLINNPYERYYRNLHIPINQKSTKKDAQSIAFQLGMLYNTLGGIIKDLVTVMSCKIQQKENSQQIEILEMEGVPKVSKKNSQKNQFHIQKQGSILNIRQNLHIITLQNNQDLRLSKHKQTLQMDIEPNNNKTLLDQFQYKPQKKETKKIIPSIIKPEINSIKQNNLSIEIQKKPIIIVNLSDDQQEEPILRQLSSPNHQTNKNETKDKEV